MQKLLKIKNQYKPGKISEFFHELRWKNILKDFAKFYIYLFIFYSLAILLVWGHAYWALEAEKQSMDSLMEDILQNPAPAEIKRIEFNFENYKKLGEQMSFCMFALVCFGVFFSIPPKKFKQVLFTVVLIYTINSGAFLNGKMWEYLDGFCILAGFSLTAWVCSCVWFILKEPHTSGFKNRTDQSR